MRNVRTLFFIYKEHLDKALEAEKRWKNKELLRNLN